MNGRLIAVVGPSGAGKDAVMDGLVAACSGLHRARRVITRADDAGEAFEPASPAQFAVRRAAGAFALHWQAHGQSYGVPAAELAPLRHGGAVIVNLSRTVLPAAAEIAPRLVVLVVTASPAVRAARIAGRGRETTGEIAARLDRKVTLPPLPPQVEVLEVANDGPLADTVAQACRALYPASGRRAR